MHKTESPALVTVQGDGTLKLRVTGPKLSDRLFLATVAKLLPESVSPNHLTASRFYLGPLAAVAYGTGYHVLGITIFVIAALTDWADGALARTRKLPSLWGIVYEPLADKLLIIPALVVLMKLHVNVILGFILCVVETIALIGMWWYVRKGRIEQANSWGKKKMAAEVLGVALLFLGHVVGSQFLVAAGIFVLVIALIFALICVSHKLLKIS